jgi:hypothetical protein
MKAKGIPKLEQCDRILIVEGFSDLHFYRAFLEHLGRAERVYIEAFKGRSQITKQVVLETFLSPKLLAEKQGIGIIVDGDSNPGGVSISLQRSLKKITGQDVSEGGWTAGAPRLGLMIVPDLETNGEIETLVWNSWAADPANAAASQEVLHYLDKMEGVGLKPKSPDKARIGAYLSVAYDEDPRLGPGAREKLFDFEAPGFARLKNFLSGL